MDDNGKDARGQVRNFKSRLQVITAMAPYQTKSFEELRFEDYTGQGEDFVSM